jgi:hypothetical protein
MHLLAAILAIWVAVSSDDLLPASPGNELPQCTVIGTPRDDDELRGTTEPDVICGFGGDDMIFARQGRTSSSAVEATMPSLGGAARTGSTVVAASTS